MVHALEKSQSLLEPSGMVLEIHDLPRPTPIEVHSPDGVSFAGYLLSTIEFKDLRQADDALVQVAEDGQFTIVGEHLFNYSICADNFAELQELLSESWDDSYLADGTEKRIKDLITTAEDGTKIVMRLTARLTVLRNMDLVG